MKMPREEWIAVSVMLIIYAITLLAMLKRALAQRKIGNFVPIVKLKRFGILSFSVIALCAATIGLLSHTNIFDYEKPIPYDRYDDITFTNFRGIELFRRSLYGSKQFAYVVTTIDVDTGNGYIRVEALFHPSRSFVYNTHTNSQELLQHEKYHFKITELFSRKIKQRIAAIENPTKLQIEQTVSELKTEERNFQRQYDDDTFHSYVFGEQKRYERNVDSLLDLLSTFKTPKLKFHEKR